MKEEFRELTTEEVKQYIGQVARSVRINGINIQFDLVADRQSGGSNYVECLIIEREMKLYIKSNYEAAISVFLTEVAHKLESTNYIIGNNRQIVQTGNSYKCEATIYNIS